MRPPAHRCLAPRTAPRQQRWRTRLSTWPRVEADPTSLPTLFAGMTPAASASTARPERASVDISRWVRPAARTSSCPPHRLTVARACCRRLPELFNHHVEGPERAGFVAEMLSTVRWRSRSSLRTCSSASRPRAAAAGPARAAVAARKPPAHPQGPRGPAGPMPAPLCVCVCVGSGVGFRPFWPLSGRKGHVRGCASCVSRRAK